ncbi:hypothetical protein AAFC00_003777 [Neodothiora populina]|uniref:Uncharacterized protein n=1 Tax=Neodothiora populina TaxID=2781224 RepID=A0ABR3PFW7_9PEZI
MTTSTSPQPLPPIRTTTAPQPADAAIISPVSPNNDSNTSSTITPGHYSSASAISVKASNNSNNNNTSFTPFPPTPDYDDVESPSLTSGNALARFEFERLDSHDPRNVGTKVLMVEWEEDANTASISGQWTVGWDGKTAAAVVPTDASTDKSGNGCPQLHRLYFLLPQWARVPGTVVLTLVGTNEGGGTEKIVWRTHPLPAIYPAALGNSARASGKRGVLHTVWAKKRLQSLAAEIENEEIHNPESISLTLAIQERDWIEQNFGIKTKPKSISLPPTASQSPLSSTPGGQNGPHLHSPTSPKSPGRGPLFEKLKGLKLATGESDLKGSSYSASSQPGTSPPTDPDQASTTTFPAANNEHNPLSPETSDVAVSWTSFANLHNNTTPSQTRDSLAAKPPQPPSSQASTPAMRTIAPPESILLEQQRHDNHSSFLSTSTLSGASSANNASGSMGSLNAFAAPLPAASSSEVQFRAPAPFTPTAVSDPLQRRRDQSQQEEEEEEEEEDLFALPLSPRSPVGGGDAGAGRQGIQAKKFTFGVEDTGRYSSTPPSHVTTTP